MTKPIKVCYICGKPGRDKDPLNKDHVPPKCIFKTTGENTSINLITLPAHTSCNSGKKADDEYLRLIVLTKAAQVNHDAKELWDTNLLRQIHRPEGRGFHKMILEGLKEYETQTSSGIILGKQHALNIDEKRLVRILFKICQGIFYKETNRVLDEATPHIVYPLIDGAQSPRYSSEIRGKFKVIGNEVFKYWWSPNGDNNRNAHFWLTFYDVIDMLVSTGTKIVQPTAAIGRSGLRAI